MGTPASFKIGAHSSIINGTPGLFKIRTPSSVKIETSSSVKIGALGWVKIRALISVKICHLLVHFIPELTCVHLNKKILKGLFGKDERGYMLLKGLF